MNINTLGVAGRRAAVGRASSYRLPRVKTLAAAVSALLGVGLATSAFAATVTSVTQDANKLTKTTISGAGTSVIDVTTKTLSSSGKTGFNSFGNFTVAQGDTVNLNVPKGAQNLVNLVWDSQAVINGTVRSVLSNGTTGGNVFFADEHGIVVGKTGVLNVGALSLSAPTHAFMESLLNSDGSLNTDDTSSDSTMFYLMTGQEPEAPSADGKCMVCVAGTVNASAAVRVRATAIDASGTIYVAGDGKDTLGTAVNTGDDADSGIEIVQDGNTIRLVADDSAAVAMGDADTATSITVSGTLKTGTAGLAAPDSDQQASWGLVSATAHAAPTAAFATPEPGQKPGLVTGQVGNLFKSQTSLAQQGFQDAAVDADVAASGDVGVVAYVRASGTANVDISGTINASGDVTLASSTETEASTEATAEAGPKAAPVMVGAMYGGIYSKATTNVESGASITSGGALKVTSDTSNSLDVSAETEAGDQLLATTVAWSQAAVDSSARVNGTVSAQSLEVTAHNDNDFSTTAVTRTSADKGSVGVTGAVSLQTVSADAQLNGSPTITTGGTGDVTVAAASDTVSNHTSALTGTGAESAKDSDDETSETKADLSGTLADKSNGGLNKKNADGSKDKSKDALPFHLGGAVAFTQSSNSANASIGSDVNLTTAGNVAVYSSVVDADIHNGASANAVSKAEEGGKDKPGVAIAAAVAYGNYSHESTATIGSGASITADHIGVGSDIAEPFDWTFGLQDTGEKIHHMFDSLDAFSEGTDALKESTEIGAQTITSGVTGFADADAGGASNVALGGSVNWLGISNDNRAWVGDGATLDATAAAGDGTWETELEWADDPIDWDESVSVSATTAGTIFDLVGDITPWKASTKADKAAIGGAFNYTGYSNDTVAGVGSGATITTANGVGVNAESTDRLIALSPISGQGGSVALNGTVSITDVSDHTHASVSGDATVTADKLSVSASNPIMIWALAGALTMSSQASVGISVAVNNTSTDTRAFVGDNSGDDPVVIAGGTKPAETGGTLTVSALDVNASSSGESGALSVAGSAVTPKKPAGGTSPGTGGGDTGESSAAPGSGLIKLIGTINSVTSTLETGVNAVNNLQNGSTPGSDNSDTTLGKAETVLGEISNVTDAASSAGEGLSKLMSRGSEEGTAAKGTAQPTKESKQSKFGIAVSGAAAVNLGSLGSRAGIDGVTIHNPGHSVDVTDRAVNKATLTSMAGAAALQRSSGGGFHGAIAGAVAFSSVGDNTSAVISNSHLSDAGDVTVQALDGSQQIDVGMSAAVNAGNGTSAAVAGSVSVATSDNTTHAGIEGNSTVQGDGAGSALSVTAYDHSRIGVGSGSLYFNTSSSASANAGLGFTYADIGNTTSADLSGHTGAPDATDIGGFDTLALQALDSSLIGSGAVAGGYSGSKNSVNLAGAIIWNNIHNTTSATIDGGMNIATTGDMTVAASAIGPVDALDSLIDDPNRDDAAGGYDFAGTGISQPAQGTSQSKAAGNSSDPSQPGAADLDLSSNAPGSSILAIAGTVQVGGNNVGLSYVGNNVANTHIVSIDDASINSGGTLKLRAGDDTRIIGLAVGLGVSTGQFAGMGSATTNIIGNKDQILLGSAAVLGKSASISAQTLDAQAGDNSHIYALAGNVAIGTGNVAAGGAVTYNSIKNDVGAHAGDTQFNIADNLGFDANENAEIMAGAVAAAASKSFALTLSFGWNQTGDTASALIDGGSTIRAGSLDVDANNASDIYALSGNVAISGKAAVGLGAVVADIGDTTSASLSDVGLDVGGATNVKANASGTQYSLAISGAVGGSGAALAGAATANTIGDDVRANVDHVYAVNADGSANTSGAAKAQSLTVSAENSAGVYSLAGGIAVNGDAGIGGSATIAILNGSTSANLSDATLDVTDATTVNASSGSTVDTASIAGAASGGVAISLSDTTNLINNSISASMTNVGTVDATGDDSVSSHNVTKVTAGNNATINALAGAVGGAGSVAAGGAIAVNRIATTTNASFDGANGTSAGPLYKAQSVIVSAGAGGSSGGSAAINTIAVGAAGGGTAAVGGSVAVNLMKAETNASIGQGADIIANDNVAVLAGNNQSIDVLAGAAGLGGTAGIGIGAAINLIQGQTTSGISHSSVTAYGNGNGIAVDSGTAADTASLDDSVDITSPDAVISDFGDPGKYVAPDLSGTTTTVHGVAVNATNAQHIATLGLGVAVAGTAAISAFAGANVVGGTTTAGIVDSQINQADLQTNATSSGSNSVSGDSTYHDQADADQQVDVRAASRQAEANFVGAVSAAITVGAAGSAAVNVFNAKTEAGIAGSNVASQGQTNILAKGQQWSLDVASGTAVSGEVSVAGSAAMTLFNDTTTATLDGGTLTAGGLDVTASNDTSGAQIGGSIGIGISTAGVAGTVDVNVDQSTTTALITDGATVKVGGDVNLGAYSTNTARAIAVGAAAGLYAGVAGGALVNVVADDTHASIQDGSNVIAANVDVEASDVQTAQVFSGMLAGGFVGIGGGINLLLQQASVGAGVLNSTVTALGDGSNSNPGNITVHASSDRDLSSTAVAVAGGAVGVGLSASVIVAGVGDITHGGKQDSGSDLNASGQANVGSMNSMGSGGKIDGKSSDYGLNSNQLSDGELAQVNTDSSYSLSGATGGTDASFGSGDGVSADVQGSTLTAGGKVAVTASLTNHTSNIAGSGAVGVVGIGGALAFTTLNTDVDASVDSASTITAGDGIDIHATAADGANGKAVEAKAYAGAGGLVGIGAAIAVGLANDDVSASDAGTLKSSNAGQGALSINAADTSSVQAGNSNQYAPNNVLLGGIVVGAVADAAVRSSTVEASLASTADISGFDTTNIGATDSGSLTANGVMTAGGLAAAVDAVVAVADDHSTVNAVINGGANIDGGATYLSATASPTAQSNAFGITVAGVAGIGADVATTVIGTTAHAEVEGNSTFGDGDLHVSATSSPTGGAEATGGAGAILLGVQATVATVTDNAHTGAKVDTGVTLPTGNVSISASTITSQSAKSLAVSAGIIAAGASAATAISNATTSASLGDGTGNEAAPTGSLSIAASGHDINDAHAIAGSGGVVSGNAAVAVTDATSTTDASMGDNWKLDKLSGFSLSATQNNQHGGEASAVNAAVVGASGAIVTNTITATTNASMGDGNSITTAGGDISVLAQTTLGNDGDNNEGAIGGAGGVVSGSAGDVTTTVTVTNTTHVGSNNTLTAGTTATAGKLGNIVLLADTLTTALGDNATMTNGGLLAATLVSVSDTVNSTNNLSVGNNDTLMSYGRTDIGTYAALEQVAATATVSAYGAGALGSADANTDLTSNQTVTIGTGVQITSFGEADIVAGRDILNAGFTELNPTASAQAYARGVVAVPDAHANANTTSNATLTFGTGSTVLGAGDVAIGAVSGLRHTSVDGTGHGFELGFIPVTDHNSDQSNSASADTTINGTVTAGQFNTINMQIAADGTVTDTGTTGLYSYKWDKNFNPTDYLNTVDNADGSYNGMADSAVGGFIFAPMYVGSGNVYLYGNDVSGNGSVTAKAPPSITIDNASPYYLVFNGMAASFGDSGKIIVSGGATLSSNMGGVSTSQAPSSALPQITIDSSYQVNPNPDNLSGLIVLNSIVNLGGNVAIKDASGSLYQEASVLANSQNVDVPNGWVVVKANSGNGYWFSGGDPVSNLKSSWMSSFLSGLISDPDHAASAAADSYYSSNAGDFPYLDHTSTYEHNILVLYGSCAPFTGGSGSESALDGCGGSGPGGSKDIMDGEYVPMPAIMALSQSGKLPSSALASQSAYTGGKFLVQAKYIDIGGAINAGQPVSWTVQAGSTASAWIAAQDSAWQHGQLSSPLVPMTSTDKNGNVVSLDYNGSALLSKVGDGGQSQLIGAVYDASKHQIVLDNVNATGGGRVSLDGNIVSTATGSINVNSGYGSVTVNNNAGVPLVVHNIYTGMGGPSSEGLVTITDHLKTWASGTNKGVYQTYWYVSQNGQAAQIYDNRDSQAKDANGKLVPLTQWSDDLASSAHADGAMGSDYTYSPLSGMEFQWNASTAVERKWSEGSSHHFWSVGPWEWAGATGGTAGQHWTIGGGTFVKPTDSGYVDLNGNDYNVAVSGDLSGIDTISVAYHGCDDDGDCHYGTHTTAGSGGDYSLWLYTYPTKASLTVTATQRADLPIAINFVTSSSSNVDISSNDNVLLDGIITNQSGPTSVSVSNGGNVEQMANNALIHTHELTMDATGGGYLGGLDNPIAVRMANNGNSNNVPDTTSTFTATTDGGNIAVNLDSGSLPQMVEALAGSGSTWGDVQLSNTASIVGGVATTGPDVAGRNITLASANGAIGSIAAPLNIGVHPLTLLNGTFDGGEINASAQGDIGLKASGGDVWVGDIASTTGDIYLEATQGGIYDARNLTTTQVLTPSQQQAIRTQLHLTDGHASDSTVAAVNTEVNANYAQYWELRNVGTVDGNGTYTLNAGAVPLYWTRAEAWAKANKTLPTTCDSACQAGITQQYVAGRYADITKVFGDYVGSDWASQAAFTGTGPVAYKFDLKTDNATEYTKLTTGATWAADQLNYALNVAALAEPSQTPVGNVTPNISGTNVTLIAGKGGVGKTLDPLQISMADLKKLYGGDGTALTSDQIAALGVAHAPGDVQLIGAAGNVLAYDSSDKSQYQQVNHLSIKQTAPLFVAATGSIGGSASGSVYLQANGDLNFSKFSSGTDMRLATTGNIQAANTSDLKDVVLKVGGDLVADTGTGYIGLGDGSGNNPGDPLPVQIDGEFLSGSAATDLLLKQVSGDLTVGTAFANGVLSLTASDGSILGTLASLSMKGGSLYLDATGNVGLRDKNNASAIDPLQFQIDPTGQLQVASGGVVNLASQGTTGNLQIGGISAGTGASDNLTLTAQNGISLLAADPNAFADEPNASGTISAGGNIDLTSNGIFSMGSGSKVAAGGSAIITAPDDITLGSVEGDATNGNAVTITSATGQIVGNGDPVNVIARGGGLTQLDAYGNIGALTLPLTVNVSTLDALSYAGSIWLHALGDLDAPSISAANALTLNVDGSLDAGQLKAGSGDADVTSGGDMTINSLTAGHDANVSSGGYANINILIARHDANVSSVGDATIGTLNAGNNAHVISTGGNATITSLTAGHVAEVDAKGAINIAMANVGDRINLEGNTINAKVKQTTTGQPIHSILTGYQGGMAKSINVYMDAPEDWMIDVLSAVNAALTTTAPNVDIAQGDIGQTMDLHTSMAHVYMNQINPALVPADVQLTQPVGDFVLDQDGVHTLTNAFIVRYTNGFQMQTPNYINNHMWQGLDYLGDSALRYNGRLLTEHTDGTDNPTHKPVLPNWQLLAGASPVQLAPGVNGVAVNLGTAQ